MEHGPDSVPMRRSNRKWVGFEAFDAIMASALAEIDQDHRMAEEGKEIDKQGRYITEPLDPLL